LRKPIQRILAACLLLGAVHSNAVASGVSPYLPLHLSPEIERQIERVLILAGRPAMTRPIAAATVIDALPAACKIDERLCRRVQRYLERYTRSAGIGDISLTAAASDGDPIALGNSYGMTSDSSWQVAAHGYWQPSPYVYVSLGGVAYEDGASPTGSVLSLGFEYAQLDIGYREHWLSPFTEHAMLISTQAKTLPSITLSNYAPLTRLGLRYEIFLAEMERSNRIRVADGTTSGEPGLAGLHLSIEPAPGWSLGANRLAQFGGGEREKSFSDFVNALIDPEEFDERGNIDLSNEFGNQLAAWTAQFIFPGPTPFTTYLEYGGEDRSYEGNYRSFSNAAMSFGISFPSIWRGLDLTYEVSEWQNSWYVHGIYRDGLTEDGHILGHWGAEARVPNGRAGAQSHLLRVGWEPSWGGLLQLRARTVENEKFPQPPAGISYERAYDLALSYSRAIDGYTAGAQVMAGQDVFGESFGRIDGFLRFGAEWSRDSLASAAAARADAREGGAELFVDAGLNANEVLVTLDAASATRSGVRTDRKVEPHFAIGARRAVSQRQDLGVRVEIDRIQDTLLIGLRALDYRYRFNGPIAVSAFLGAARYDLATPAMGYYGGVGVQWRDALPRVDIGLDARYADKIQRDKLLPGEVITVRPDSFWDISSVTLYASYKW
jgi:hypothetical protein